MELTSCIQAISRHLFICTLNGNEKCDLEKCPVRKVLCFYRNICKSKDLVRNIANQKSPGSICLDLPGRPQSGFENDSRLLHRISIQLQNMTHC